MGTDTVDRLRRPFTLLWSIIVGGFLTAFAVVEYYALKDKRKGDTLTEHVRASIAHPAVKTAFGVVWLWLAFHFLTDSNWPFG